MSRDTGCIDTGVIAQEVAQILPEAVRPAGDLILDNGTAVNNFLVVNKVIVFIIDEIRALQTFVILGTNFYGKYRCCERTLQSH